MTKSKDKIIPIGKKIRKARLDKKITLDFVANETGLTTNYLKEIESGVQTPSVSTLLQISRALELDSAFFLKTQKSGQNKRIHAHVKRTDNYAYSSLSPETKNKHLKAFRITIEKMQEHKGVGYQHEGEEFVYLLSGKVEVTVGDHINSLKPGESLQFNSGIKHNMKNISNEDAELIVVIYSP